MKYWNNFFRDLENRYLLKYKYLNKCISRATYYNCLKSTTPRDDTIEELSKSISKFLNEKNYDIDKEKEYVKDYFKDIITDSIKNIFTNENNLKIVEKDIMDIDNFELLLKEIFYFFIKIDRKNLLNKTPYININNKNYIDTPTKFKINRFFLIFFLIIFLFGVSPHFHRNR